MNKWRILSVGLAMSLMMSQVSFANVYITPFGTTQTVQESTVTETTDASGTVDSAGASSEGMTVGAQYGPGYENTGAAQSGAGESKAETSAVQNVTETQSAQAGTSVQTQGPGGTVPAVTNAVKPSASYSTKEPVQIVANQNVQAAGPGASMQTGTTVQTQGPGVTVQTQGPGSAAETTTQTNTEQITVEIAEPEIAAESAILYDVTHDRVLFEKNADTKRYPASITKLLTALLVLEHAGMNETVTYSETAVTNLESGAVTLQLQAGDQVSVKDSLYGLMLKSANEVANGLAEHVGGSIAGFAEMMNAKAKALGCTGSNFVNPNGLNNSNHYTTARDMAKIAAAAFQNQTLCDITSTTSYKFPATKAAAARTITMGHKMLYENDARYYEGIIGGKTGYTSLAGNTLVTCVEQNGVRMIAVVLKSQSTHYTDTKAMLNYGYELEKAGACGFSGTAYHKWIADGDIWRFELADGSRLTNCFVTIDGVEYAFDTEGKMVTGWLELGENWHFFGNSGGMIKADWRKDGEYWFYLGADGAMLRNTWIDNQYYVGADGVWIE